MSAMVGPIICLLSLVLIPSDYAARSQPFPNHYEQDSGRKQPSPNLDDILLRLKLNLDQYLTTLPSFFCNEHVVSQLSHQLSVKTAKRNVTNSISVSSAPFPKTPQRLSSSHVASKGSTANQQKMRMLEAHPFLAELSPEALPLSLSIRTPAYDTTCISSTPAHSPIET